MYHPRLLEHLGHHPVGVPFTQLLAKPTQHGVSAILNREDGLEYRPEAQVNVYGGADPLSMGRSTCNRRNSTGWWNLDNDRQQDD
jgi:hypothetical protein